MNFSIPSHVRRFPTTRTHAATVAAVRRASRILLCLILCAAASERCGAQDRSSVTGDGWGAAVPLPSLPGGFALHWPSIAMSHDTLIVAGRLVPATREAAGTAPHGVIVLQPGGPVPLPPSAVLFAHPRSYVDAQKVYHVVWGESSVEEPGVPTDARTITDLWHASLSRGRWTAVQRVLHASNVRWGGDQGALFASSDGAPAVIASVTRNGSHNTVLYARLVGGTWSVSDLNMFATYASGAAQGHLVRSVFLSPDDRTPRRPLALLTRSSTDGGASWSQAALVAPVDPRSARSITLVTTSATAHVLWLEASPSPDSMSVRHYSLGAGKSAWSEQPTARIPNGTVLRLWAAVTPCQDVIALVETAIRTRASARLQLRQVMWSRNTVSSIALFPDAASTGSSALTAGKNTLALLAGVSATESPDAPPRIATRTVTCGPASKKAAGRP